MIIDGNKVEPFYGNDTKVGFIGSHCVDHILCGVHGHQVKVWIYSSALGITLQRIICHDTCNREWYEEAINQTTNDQWFGRATECLSDTWYDRFPCRSDYRMPSGETIYTRIPSVAKTGSRKTRWRGCTARNRKSWPCSSMEMVTQTPLIEIQEVTDASSAHTLV